MSTKPGYETVVFYVGIGSRRAVDPQLAVLVQRDTYRIDLPGDHCLYRGGIRGTVKDAPVLDTDILCPTSIHSYVAARGRCFHPRSGSLQPADR